MLTNYQKVLKEMEPTAYITRNKQRVKQNEGIIYLKNGDEFELELYNRSTKLKQNYSSSDFLIHRASFDYSPKALISHNGWVLYYLKVFFLHSIC